MAEERVQRRLAAILSADVVGFSRLMGVDEAGTLARLKALQREIINPTIATYAGRTVKLMGDGALVEFASAVDAVTCAIEIQKLVDTHERDAGRPPDSTIRFRIGINVGDIIVDGDDIFGDGVNVAARIEALAEPGEIYISRAAADQVRGKVPMQIERRGERTLKNIADPVEVFRIRGEGPTAPAAAADESAPAPRPPVPDKPSIAVLAFNNMSGDAEQAYFSDGISEDIITDLSKVSGLHVIARNSSFVYKNGAVSIPQVARELGVRYVLEGSVRRAGNRVRVTAQLIDSTTGGHVWADRFDRDLTDIFAVQDELTREIVGALKLNLAEGEKQRLTSEPTNNIEAYDWFLRGREQWWRATKESNIQAQEMLQRAIKLDPNFASAHAFLALAHMHDYANQWSTSLPRSLERLQALAQRAVALDDSHPNAHFALGSAYFWMRRHDQAIDEAERALSLDPSFALGHTFLGHSLIYVGRSEEALPHFDRAMALDPHYPDLYLHFQALALFHLGRYEEAIGVLKRRLIRNPDTDISRVLLAASYGHLGRIDEARAEWAEAFRVNPDYSLEHRRKVLPYKNPADFEVIVDGLRKAGLVE